VRRGAEITAGTVKVPESRVIAHLMLRGFDEAAWKKAIYDENRLEEMTEGLQKSITPNSATCQPT
jgi:hypothetical protein